MPCLPFLLCVALTGRSVLLPPVIVKPHSRKVVHQPAFLSMMSAWPPPPLPPSVGRGHALEVNERFTLGGTTWATASPQAFRCRDTARGFVLGWTTHPDPTAARLIRDWLYPPENSYDWIDWYPSMDGGWEPRRFEPRWAPGPERLWSPSIGYRQRMAAPDPVGNLDSVALPSPDSLDPILLSEWNTRAWLDPFNPTTVLAIVDRGSVIGRIRRAQLPADPPGTRTRPAFAQVTDLVPDLAFDPDDCELFLQSRSGLWYRADGKDGSFHDVTVPDTVAMHRPVPPYWSALPPAYAWFLAFTTLVLVGTALFQGIPSDRKGRLAFAAGVLLVAGGCRTWEAWSRSHPRRPPPAVSDLEHSFEDLHFVVERLLRPGSPDTSRFHLSDSVHRCLDTGLRLVAARRGDRWHGTLGSSRDLVGEADLGSARDSLHVAWNEATCAGFVGSGSGFLFRVDIRDGFRRAFSRSRAHFLFGLDTTPEVRKWWEDDALLPPGREPDITVLPPPARILVPNAALRWTAEGALSLLGGLLFSQLFGWWHRRRKVEDEDESGPRQEDSGPP